MCGGAVSGNHLPNPIPPRVRRHASLAQIPRTVGGGSREHARGAPVTQWLLRCTGGLRGIHAAVGPDGRTRSDRPLEHALNPAVTPQGATHVRTPTPLRGLRHGRGPLGGVQLRPRPRGPSLVRHLARRRGGHGPRTGRRHGRLPGAAAPVRARCGPAARRGTRAPSWPSSQDRKRDPSRRSSHWGKLTGRLTGFRARTRIFSANFRPPRIRCRQYPPPPVRPARKGSPGPPAPYVDWPLRRGALPCTARECNAS